MIDFLKSILERSDNWLKFAEAKNTILIVFNSTLLFSILKMVSSLSVNILYKYYIFFVISLLFISIILLILSFIPRLQPPWLKITKKSDQDNLLYFGDISKYSPKEYINNVSDKFNLKSENYNLEKEYGNQIVVNSQIAFMKFKQFEIASWFTLSAIITPIGLLFLLKLRD